MKKTETREETLERLAKDASSGKAAAKRFESVVKMVARAPKSEIAQPQQTQSATPE
ncbi:MAG: hypothetical protein QOF24_2662 [Verrucomicrobiota bacterium]|jgi:hypothetical protein